MAATPVYFLPGTMCDQRLWQPVWEKLPATLDKRFISLAQGNSFQALEAHITSQLADTPIHLVGFSMGGYVALNYALAHPEQIQSLTIISSSAKGLKEVELAMREYTLQYLEKNAYNGIAMARIKQLLHPKNAQNQEVIDMIKAMDKSLGKKVLISQLKATSKRVSLLNRLPELDFPVLLVGSAHDQLVQQTDLIEMYQELSDGKLVLFEDCGHMIPLEQPQQLAETLEEWFTFHS